MNKIVGVLITLSIIIAAVFGGLIVVATTVVTCGARQLNPLDEVKDIFGIIAEGTSDTFFNLFASEGQKTRKANAALIVKIGQDRNFSPYSIGIAVATAIQESKLENLPYQGIHNDHKSLGLFQQQPPWWGTPEQIMDPVYATNKFYDKLQTIPDRDERPMIDVAIEVQIPDKAVYRKTWPDNREDVAMSIVKDNYQGDGKVGDNCTSSPTIEAGWQLPLHKRVYDITSPFGWRCLSGYACKNHDGVDLGAAAQTPIYAAHDGTITYYKVWGTYGNFVRIDHGNGIVTEYGHLSKYQDGLKEGSAVRGGEVIGYVGTTGKSTGNHLHFNVMVDGEYVDPVPYMKDLGVDIKGNQQ